MNMAKANYTVNLDASEMSGNSIFYSMQCNSVSVRLEISKVVCAIMIPFMSNKPVTLSNRQCMSHKSKLNANATIFVPNLNKPMILLNGM